MTPEAIALIAISVSLASFLFQQFGVIAQVKQRLAALETKMELFWKAAEQQMVKLLHSPVHAEKDSLLHRVFEEKDHEDLEAMDKLRRLLQKELDHREPNHLNLTYALAIGRLDTLIYEAKGKKK